MLSSEYIQRHRELIWRIAGLWTVVLALGLALIGMFLALHQIRSFTLRLMAQAESLAVRVAADTREELDRELERVLSTASRNRSAYRPAAPSRAGPAPGRGPDPSLPKWVNGLYLVEGGTVQVLVRPPEKAEQVREFAQARFAPKPWPMIPEPPRDEPRFAFHSMDGQEVVLAYATFPQGEGGWITVAVQLDPSALRSEFVQPRVPTSAGLALVHAEEATGPWHQRLSGPLRKWAIKPTDAFFREQRSTVIGQTAAYLGLTLLSLTTLILALWFVARLARREVALAEMKANFVADVSHELKTPLALIHMFAETLQSGRITTEEKRNDYYAIIMRESTRLTNLINNILDFARIEAGRKEYTLEAIDVGRVVRETYEAYRPQLDHNRFEHHLTVDASLPAVQADRDAVAQAVVNLLSNAIKYSSDERYVAIDVTRDTRRGKHGVLISVNDRGIGIRPEDRAHLAEGFFRSADGRVRQRGGAGLGLALVRHIVEAHHGTFDAEPRLVKGSTFRIFLPSADPKGSIKSNPEGGEPAPSQAPGPV